MREGKQSATGCVNMSHTVLDFICPAAKKVFPSLLSCLQQTCLFLRKEGSPSEQNEVVKSAIYQLLTEHGLVPCAFSPKAHLFVSM